MAHPLLADAPAFPLACVGDRTVRFAEALVVAGLSGALAPFLADLGARLAAVPPGDPDLPEDALTDWRYARGLVAVDELDAWLAARGLRLDHVLAHLARARVAPRPDAPAPVDGHVWAEAACSGELDRWMAALGQRVAVWEAWRDDGAPPLDLPPAASPGPAADLVGDPAPLVEADRVFRARLAPLLAEDALAELVRAAPTALLRFDLVRLRFRTLDAAAEARLCLVADGEPPDAVARHAAVPADRVSRLACELPEALEDALVSAVAGEVVGPIPTGDTPTLYVLVGKRAASLEDPVTRARLVDLRTEEAFADLVAERVRWPAWRPAPPAPTPRSAP